MLAEDLPLGGQNLVVQKSSEESKKKKSTEHSCYLSQQDD
jgi:hypothetical protein